MQNLTPRLIGDAEARRLGIPRGWYGTRVSGTLMTGACATLERCVAAIDLLPEPVDIAVPATPDKAISKRAHVSISARVFSGELVRTPYQIGRKTSRSGER